MRDETNDKIWYVIGLICKECLSALLWAWLVLAIIADDPFTAIMLLVLRSLVWAAIGKEYRR